MNDPGNLLAEFVNSRPFVHHQLEGGLEVADRLHGRLRLFRAPGAQPVARPDQLFGHLTVKSLRRRQ